jgi:hypothetical protein
MQSDQSYVLAEEARKFFRSAPGMVVMVLALMLLTVIAAILLSTWWEGLSQISSPS